VPPVALDFSKPLTGAEIAAIAVLANPDLRALRTQQRVADAQVFASGLLPDPQLSAGFDAVLSPDDPTLSTGYTIGLSFDLLAALVTRDVEHMASQAAAEKVRLDVAWQEWTTAGQAQILAVRLAYQRQAADLASTAADAAEQAQARAVAAARSGDLNGDELEARRIAAADARDRALTTAREAEATRLQLNRILGLNPSEALSLADPDVPSAWKPPSADELFVKERARRLDLRALEQGYASQEATLHRAVLGQYPRLGITLNRARDTSAVNTFGPAVTLDLPLWNRNRGGIALASADRDRLRAEYAARLYGTRAEIAELVAELNINEAAHADLGAQMPELQRAAAAYEQAARQGDIALPVAESVRAAALDKQLAWVVLAQSCAEQRIALRVAMGLPLSNSSTDTP
jgi:outer membrane protein TolC